MTYGQRMKQAVLDEVERRLGRAVTEEGRVIIDVIVEGLDPGGAPGLWELVSNRVLRSHEIDPEGARKREEQVRKNTERSHAEMRGEGISNGAV